MGCHDSTLHVRGSSATPLQINSYVSTPVLTPRTPSGPLVSRLQVLLKEKISEALVVISFSETKRPFNIYF